MPSERPFLTTADCASALGVSVDFVRGEIKDRRLRAEVVEREPRPGRSRGNRAIRVYPEAWADYLQRYWPQHPACSTGNNNRQNG